MVCEGPNAQITASEWFNTVEPRYNEVLGTIKITLLSLVIHVSGFSLYQGEKTKI